MTLLANKLRPHLFTEILGQDELFLKHSFLQKLSKNARFPSVIFCGPPGVGKTTLARIVCRQCEGEFVSLSAVSSGVKDLRQVAEDAKNRGLFQRPTFLFIDEIHRLQRVQQDALLPMLEEEICTLIGATTENPSFALSAPLLSRSQVIVLKPLSEEALSSLLDRGLSLMSLECARNFALHFEARALMVQWANGDARKMLNALEIAIGLVQSANTHLIGLTEAQNACGHKLIRHDQKGDLHYGLLSALMKSIRGSDAQAAVYYTARLLEAGEDPRVVFRRIMILASEDIGNADPRAIQVAVSAFHAYEAIGLPEGYLPLTQAVIYLACAPKSNAVIKAYEAAQKDVERFGSLPIPLHLQNPVTSWMKSEGYGKDYVYVHKYGGYVKGIDYLPEQLREKIYYKPTANGFEKIILEKLNREGQGT